MISYQVLQGDSYDVLHSLSKNPEQRGKYRIIITSPPYFLHRHYGQDLHEIGQEKNAVIFIEKLAKIFISCRDLLTEDGSLWIVIGDTRRKSGKLMIPHRLAFKLIDGGYTFRDDVIWYKKNNVSSSSKYNLTQAYEIVLFLSKNERSFTNMNSIRVRGNEARDGRNKVPSSDMIQFEPLAQDKEKITRMRQIIHDAKHNTPFEELPTTSDIARAYGYDPEKYCPTCYRKFKRHATRKRIGDHKHYPIFAVCNPQGKNPTNVWEVPTKAHYGNEHFAIFPEDLIARIVKFATEKGDWVLDPFAGRGTTGIVSAYLERNFLGVELYSENVSKARENIMAAAKGQIAVKVDS
jgi:DNA modification methylase